MINLYLHAGSDNHGCEAIVRSTVTDSQGSDKDIREKLVKTGHVALPV